MILILIAFGYLAIGTLVTFLSILWENHAPAKWSLIISEETFAEHCTKVLLAWPLFVFIAIILLIALGIRKFVENVFIRFDSFIKGTLK